MKLSRENDGTLPASAWPGGYSVRYLLADGAWICADCANGKNGSEASEDAEDRQWRIIGADVLWEGPALQCEHCGKEMPTEYGDPDAPEDTA